MLNTRQQKAVEMPHDTPLLVLAGAGTGKPSVITYRILHLCKNMGLDPRKVLAVTFTKKAATEMSERLVSLHPNLEMVRTGTFHSAAISIMRSLRSAPIESPISKSNYTIMDAKDQRNLVKGIIAENLPVDGLFEEKKDALDTCVRYINSRKEAMQRSKDVTDNYKMNDIQRYCFLIYGLYENLTRAQNLYDFTEIILKLYLCLKKHEHVRDVASSFSHILVDEFQDTNKLQYEFIKLLLNGRGALTVVGDDDQSIYAWRGSKIDYIIGFEKHFERSNKVTLEENYRSTKTILTAANNVIKNNEERHEKTLFSNLQEGEVIDVVEARSNFDEANYVAEEIMDEMNKGADPKDIAVLFRSNFQTFAIEIVFSQFGIPYKVTGGQNFFDREEIKAVLAYLKMTINPNDSVALETATSFPRRRIGQKILKTVGYKAHTQGLTLIEAMEEETGKGSKGFSSVMSKLISQNAQSGLGDLIHTAIYDTGVYDYFASLKDTEKAENKTDNLNALMDNVKTYADHTSLEEFLESVALTAEGNKKGDEKNSVSFSTIHGAKGLEFPIVHMIGMSEGIFPSRRAVEADSLPEERRLAYVGITRAKKKLKMSSHMVDQQGNSLNKSRFIREMELPSTGSRLTW